MKFQFSACKRRKIGKYNPKRNDNFGKYNPKRNDNLMR